MNLVNAQNYNYKKYINIDNDEDENTIIDNNDEEDDIEMKDESKNNLVKYNKYPQDVDEYFDDICEELKNNEEKYLTEPNYM